MEEQNSTDEMEGSTARKTNADYKRDLESQFAMLPMALFVDQQEKRLTYMDVCVYAYLLAKKGQKTYVYWGIDRLTELTGITATSLKKSFRNLSNCGHIERKKKMTGASQTYCLTRVENKRIVKEGTAVRG